MGIGSQLAVIYLVFGSENLHAKAILLRGDHPGQLCQQSIVYVFEFSESKTTRSLWNTKFVPRLPSKEFAFFLFLFPPKSSGNGIHFVTYLLRDVESRHGIRKYKQCNRGDEDFLACPG